MIIESKVIDYNNDLYPQKLLDIKGFPKQLHYIGNEKLLNSAKIIAIVGSRDCSEYGRKYARIFAMELARYNICVVSGLAIGIDAAAHFGAVYEKGRTIAVLGGGFNHLYPKENRWLFNEIIANEGCVITEHADDDETKLTGFPRRNRIISGIADGVLIVEAKKNSGTKVTARYAKQQGKKLYCIPHSLDSKNGTGVNELILNGGKFVTEPMQIVKDLYNLEEIPEIEYEQQNIIQVSEEYREIFYLLKEQEMTKDEISRKLDKNISEVNAILTMMELEGYVRQTSGNLFKVRKD